MTSPPTGRFAPSPTGPLHFGSVVTALASYLDARSRGGRWLLRIDDLDPPREAPGAADGILATLVALGLEWDGEVTWQSRRGEAYRDALSRLADTGVSFPCACTRATVGKGPYPGTCRNGLPPGRRARAVRVRVGATCVGFEDRVQGNVTRTLAEQGGDFIVRRADGLIAYHLAVVVDDAAAGITDVVRGVDLLDTTPQQIHLQRQLGLSTPTYAHLGVVLGPDGHKLSKQTGARPVLPAAAALAAWAALDFLGLSPPVAARGAPAAELLQWALPRWAGHALPRAAAVYDDGGVQSAAANIARSAS
ncbi:MAG: tRNA glutamyl-Q(34) synthetase GluQRS [Gammaproteobacteria bacterium]